MQNIETILANFGLEIPEDNKSDFMKSFNENYKTVNEVAKIKAEKDKLKEQYSTATEMLKQFEGINPEELNGQIKALNEKLQAQEKDYQAKLKDVEFDSFLEKGLRDSGTIDTTALKAHLDIKALKESVNREADLKSQIDAVKGEKKYLFDDEPIKTAVAVTQTQKSGEKLTWKQIMATKDSKERQELIEAHRDLIPQ